MNGMINYLLLELLILSSIGIAFGCSPGIKECFIEPLNFLDEQRTTAASELIHNALHQIDPTCCSRLTFKDMNQLNQIYSTNWNVSFLPDPDCLAEYREPLNYSKMNYLFLFNPSLAVSLLKNYNYDTSKHLYSKWRQILLFKNQTSINLDNGVDLRSVRYADDLDTLLCSSDQSNCLIQQEDVVKLICRTNCSLLPNDYFHTSPFCNSSSSLSLNRVLKAMTPQCYAQLSLENRLQLSKKLMKKSIVKNKKVIIKNLLKGLTSSLGLDCFTTAVQNIAPTCTPTLDYFFSTIYPPETIESLVVVPMPVTTSTAIVTSTVVVTSCNLNSDQINSVINSQLSRSFASTSDGSSLGGFIYFGMIGVTTILNLFIVAMHII